MAHGWQLERQQGPPHPVISRGWTPPSASLNLKMDSKKKEGARKEGRMDGYMDSGLYAHMLVQNLCLARMPRSFLASAKAACLDSEIQ